MALDIELKTELDKISDKVKEAGEKALAEAKKGIELTEGQKSRIDEMLLTQGELVAQVKELEQKAARRSADEGQGTKSAGQLTIESEGIKAAAEAAASGRRVNTSINVKAITSATGTSAGNVGQAIAPDRRPGIALLPNRRLTVRDLMMPGRTESGVVIYGKETGFVNNAAPVAEGARKPESNITMVAVTETAKKIATFIKASTEVLADLPQLASIIDGRLRYMLAIKEEAQLLLGSGSGNNLNGIYTQATAYLLPTGATASTTTIDKLRLALLQSELAEFPADGLVLNPIDWTNIELLKDTTGQYLIGNPQGTLSPTLWNRPVVSTQAMTVGTFLAGAFGMGSQIFDRMDANVVIATENEDDFVNNLITVLIEERLAMAVYRPEAFVKGAV